MTEPGLNELNAVLARVPSVERVLSSTPLQPLIDDYGRTRVLNAVRAELENADSSARGTRFTVLLPQYQPRGGGGDE